MSYTEYLRRKAAAAPVIVDTRLRLDASSFTNRVKLAASSTFPADGQRYGVITNVSNPDSSGNIGNLNHALGTFKKQNGGRTPDASTYTLFCGSQALANQQLVPKAVRYLLNSDEEGSLSGCTVIPEPDAGVPSASQATRDAVLCHQIKGQKHLTNATTHPGPPVFVDNTVVGVKNYNLPQNKTKYQNAVKCNACGKNPTGTGVPCSVCLGAANHAPPANMPHNTRWGRRPTKAAQPIIVVPSPSDARKVGDFTPSRPVYVEKHHGNPNIGHIQYPDTPYQIPASTPAQLKINDPRHYPGTM
jgi:hypothetical protein